MITGFYAAEECADLRLRAELHIDPPASHDEPHGGENENRPCDHQAGDAFAEFFSAGFLPLGLSSSTFWAWPHREMQRHRTKLCLNKSDHWII